MPSSVLVVLLLVRSEITRKYGPDSHPQRPRERYDCCLQPVLTGVIDSLGERKGWGDEYNRIDRHLSQHPSHAVPLPYHVLKYDVCHTSDASDIPERVASFLDAQLHSTCFPFAERLVGLNATITAMTQTISNPLMTMVISPTSAGEARKKLKPQ